MGKRIAISLIIILTSGLAILGYFLYRGKQNLLSDPYQAIPKGAVLVVETADLQNLLNTLSSGKGLAGEIREMKGFESFKKSVEFLSLQLKREEFMNLVKGRTAVISWHNSIKGRLKPLFSMTLPDGTGTSEISKIFELSGFRNMSIQRHAGRKIIILPFTVNTKTDSLFVSINKGLFLCSTSLNLLSDATRQTGISEDVRDEPGFSKVLAVSGRNEDKIYIIFPNLAPFVSKAFSEEYSQLPAKIARIADTGVGDIYFNNDGIILSGYIESSDSSDFIYRFKSISPGSFHTYSILPSSTMLFESIIIPGNAPLNRPDTIIPQYTADLASGLREYIGEEATRAMIETRGGPSRDNMLFIYELNNRVQAEQVFLTELGKNNNESKLLFFEPGEQVRIPVYKTPFRGLARLLFPGNAGKSDDSYVTFYGNFMITGSSYATISKFLYDNLLNKTLANDLVYRDFESSLPSRSVYLFYCIPSLITGLLSDQLSPDLNRFLEENRVSVSKILAAGYSLMPSNNMIYNSVSFRFREEARQESTADWQTLLDTTAAIKPFFFTNHINQSKEIFVQDLKNNAYLISSAGLILWKVPLEERINGQVYMIDYYRNGKYQLLFAGKSFLHLLDRNGNYVERYPVRLRSPATSPLSLFDYDNNRDYRMLIAGEDKLVYAYDRNGNLVKGWKPFRTAGTVTSEISYFRVSGKDYIVISDDQSMYFLDRRGNVRLKPKEAVMKASGSAVRLVQGAEPFLVCSSPEGILQNIYFNGEVQKFELKNIFTSNHYFDDFDINEDGFGENIFIDRGKIYLYDYNKEEIFTKDFGPVELKGPATFIFSASDRKIGIFDSTNNLIYLIDEKGEIMNGFPLKGVSMFSVGKLSEKGGWNLIVGGPDKFLYNYRIDTEN